MRKIQFPKWLARRFGGSMMSSPRTQPPPDLATLLPSARTLTDAAFDFGSWQGCVSRDGVTTPGFFALSPGAQAFVTAAYDGHWVRHYFDWSEWAGSDRYAELRSDPDAVGGADVDDIAHMLTTLIRGDRFNEGLLARAFDDGVLRRIARRIEQLADGSDVVIRR